MVETIQWTADGVVMIDQTVLPRETSYVTCRDYVEVASAIKTMIIRGAPAIGVAAAMGVAIGVLKTPDSEVASKFDLRKSSPKIHQRRAQIARRQRRVKSDSQSAGLASTVAMRGCDQRIHLAQNRLRHPQKVVTRRGRAYAAARSLE